MQSAVDDLLQAPKARWVLAWLAAAPDATEPVDAFTVSETRPGRTRLDALRTNPAGLLAEVHTLVEDWRNHHKWLPGHIEHAVDKLGPPEAYRPVAEALRAAPAAAWWWQPMDRSAQSWLCTTPGVTEVKPVRRSTIYGHHPGITGPLQVYVTSTRLPGLPAAELLPDQRPVHHPRPEGWSVWSAAVAPAARVYEIHSPRDWTALVERFLWHRTTLCQAPHLAAVWPSGASMYTPAWDELTKHYDGVRLSPAGWLTATSRLLPLPGSPDQYTFCEGWQSERTIWFRHVFDSYAAVTATAPVEYGYGRPCTGSPVDLRQQAPVVQRLSWWNPRRWLPRRPARVDG